jgi:hypothetical protein
MAKRELIARITTLESYTRKIKLFSKYEAASAEENGLASANPARAFELRRALSTSVQNNSGLLAYRQRVGLRRYANAP